ncbi:MAG: transcriptional repressor LexA [Candidatus Omnitrophica bacterium]|nr:transcriptional repressor LexA [Candidatus Omnitrophota bacterium]
MKRLTTKQREILAYIARFMRKTGYPPTVREIGKHFGIAASSVFDHLKALEAKGALKKTEGKSRSLVVAKNTEDPEKRTALLGSTFRDDDTVKTIQIPLLGRVAAGLPMLAEENIEEMVTLPRQWVRAGKIFALRVQGDSMTGDGIYDGDCAIVRMQSEADNGDIVVAMLEDEATVKRFYKRGRSICLHAANEKYEDIISRNVKILGKVVGLFRNYA